MYVQYINFCALTEVGFLVLRPREGNLMTVTMMMMLMMMTTVRQCEDRSVNMKKPSRRVTLQCARDGQNSEITRCTGPALRFLCLDLPTLSSTTPK
jgi:hypothetical protein